MPRERVQHGKLWVHSKLLEGPDSEEYVPDKVLSEDQYVSEQPSIDISWNRDVGYAQLNFDAPRDWWERFFKSYENSPEQTRISVYSDVLSRNEINHMIRTLRRARDAAYGADA